ncbi:MAG: hypothetical protein K6F51_09500 [Acetatifactor sp.]|nr:hypothetical protein [Acetatifactor sp.]
MKKVIKILAPTLTFIVFAVTINWGYVGLLSKQLIQAATEVASGNGTTSQMLLEELKDFQARDIFNMQVIQKLPFVDSGDGTVTMPVIDLPGDGVGYALPTSEPWSADEGSGSVKATNIKSEDLIFGSNTKSAQKLANQMSRRGWTEDLVKQTVDAPYTTRASLNKATGNDATVFYTERGSYVIVDDVTYEIVQVSDNVNPETWAPDPCIVDPYVPKRGNP